MLSPRVIAEVWQVDRMRAEPVTIYPDGCRDVIWYQLKGQAPCWRLTPLDLAARVLDGVDGAQMRGYRLRPGAVVADDLLRGALRTDSPEGAEQAIEDMSTVPHDVAEVLAGCARNADDNVAALARRLSVSPRSLQRLMAAATGQGPLYWLRLARLRRAFRAGMAGEPLAQAAAAAGFADQAHFTREARHFHRATPSRLLCDERAMVAILAPGLDAEAVSIPVV